MIRASHSFYRIPLFLTVFACLTLTPPGHAQETVYELNDSHFHLTNYIQEGTDIHDFLDIMGDKVGRVALFGIPLQQTWSYQNSGDYAPNYYLQSDAPLYYYSFTDAHIAMAYKSLTPEQQARFDPMITGFNPADMYGVEHIRRVLETFPGVFTGIGEFTIHKEFVSSKVAGEVASLTNPALDRILEFAGEAGLLVLLHSDIDIPFQKPEEEPVYLAQMKALLKRHPNTTIIWAHAGLGRVIHPIRGGKGLYDPADSHIPLEFLEEAYVQAGYGHVYFDISWDEVAKYIVSDPRKLQQMADIINSAPDRFLFGTDEVAPTSQETYLKVYRQYQPLWDKLSPEARYKVKRGNYERLFDAAKRKVRTWEKTHIRK